MDSFSHFSSQNQTLRAQKGLRSYHFVPPDKRETIIEMVFQTGLPMLQVSKQLQINYSTVKCVCRKFKKQGVVREHPNSETKKRNQQQITDRQREDNNEVREPSDGIETTLDSFRPFPFYIYGQGPQTFGLFPLSGLPTFQFNFPNSY